MAGGFDALFSQTFTSTDAITVTHNLDRVVFAVRVLIGDVARNDLVQTITPSASDPRNIIEVTLTSSQSGLIQIIDSDYLWGTLPSPEGAAALQNNISGSTFSGSFSGSFFGDGSNLTGVTADWDGTHVGDAQITGTLYVTEAVEATSFTGSFFGDGSFITNAQVSGSNLLWVDVSGSDASGTRERFDKPYASIGGALSSASAGDAIIVRPGTYEETITMVDGVSITGMDRDRCILKNYTSGYTVTMADNCSFENMSLDINNTNGVTFDGTTGGTSAVRHTRITSAGGAATGINIGGTPAPAVNWVTCDHVDVIGSGFANAYLHQSSGSVNLRDCIGEGALIGLGVSGPSTTRVQDCRFTGFYGIYIADAGASIYVDQSTRWSSLYNPSTGTFAPDLTHLLVATGSVTEIQISSGNFLSSSANLTFSGSLLAVTGALSVTESVIAQSFTGSLLGDITGTSSFATEAAKVSNALVDGTGITNFSFDGSSPTTVSIDESIVVTLTGSQTLTNKIITGSFEGDLVGTASFANEVGRVENALVDGTGITTLFFDGATPGTNVSIDQSIVVTLTGSQTLSNKVVSGSFSGSFVGDGSGLTGIGGGGTPGGSNTQIQYNNAGAFGGSANFTFDSSGTALALTGTFNGRRYYPDSTTDPSSPTPADSDIYYNTVLDMQMIYDATRSKWLSVDSSIMEFGRNGNTGGGAYYRGPGNKAYTAARGRTAEYDGTVVSIAYTRNDLDAATFEVTADGTGIATLASSARTGKDITLDGDFSADDILGVKNQTGSNTTSGVSGWVRVRWRV